VFGREFEIAYHRNYGVVEEALRISVGLEEWEDLRDTVDEAVRVASDVWAQEKKEGKNGEKNDTS
jgi:hypothetical protein